MVRGGKRSRRPALCLLRTCPGTVLRGSVEKASRLTLDPSWLSDYGAGFDAASSLLSAPPRTRPRAGGKHGSDLLTDTMNDGGGGISTTTVTLDIFGIDSAWC